MEPPNPYATPLEPEQPPLPDADLRLERLLKAGAEGTAAGLLIALVEVNNLVEYGGLFLLLFIASGVLGFRHGFCGGALAWLPLGGLIFPTHLITMLVFGYRQPSITAMSPIWPNSPKTQQTFLLTNNFMQNMHKKKLADASPAKAIRSLFTGVNGSAS